MTPTNSGMSIRTNPATSPSWFFGAKSGGSTTSKICRISLCRPRDTGRKLCRQLCRRSLSGKAAPSPASSSLSRNAASSAVSPLATPPPTMLSSLFGSTALSALRRPIQNRQPPRQVSPFRCMARLNSPNGRKAARSRANSGRPASSHTSKYSPRQPRSTPASRQPQAVLCRLRPKAAQLSPAKCRPSESSPTAPGQSFLSCAPHCGFRRPKGNPLSQSVCQLPFKPYCRCAHCHRPSCALPSKTPEKQGRSAIICLPEY